MIAAQGREMSATPFVAIIAITPSLRHEGQYHSRTRLAAPPTRISRLHGEAARGDIKGAATIVMQANLIPMITSRVCAHFCQDGCNRKTTDQAISAHAVERSVGDYILENLDTFYVRRRG
jgi:hypothetical protein